MPDKLEDFVNRFIESSGNVKNVEQFKKRIIGLTSYYRSAQEKLLPRYNKLSDYHVLKIPMSDYQFDIYETARKQERKMEKSAKTQKGKVDASGIYKEPTSTYRIFSRLYCNFVMPTPPGRPLPMQTNVESANAETDLNKNYKEALKKADKADTDSPVSDIIPALDIPITGDEANVENVVFDEVLEGDAVIEKNADESYERRLKSAMDYISQPEHAKNIFDTKGLEKYSPKYLYMLDNIKNPDHKGLHLIYSQFRTLEGIGLFKLTLEYNGFTQFKIKRNPQTGLWELDISEENKGKPTFALYTGTESKEEKDIIRNIYNGDWNELNVDPTLLQKLRETANNNNMGEIIKVLMITSSGSEGINLRNTRYVHIMEPYWHPIRSEQVIGRAKRICSHKNLPYELQTVEVFVYLMTFSKEQIQGDLAIELKVKDVSKKEYDVIENGKTVKRKMPLTSDEALFEISSIKEEVNSKLMTAIKEASIDCSIYSTTESGENLRCLQFGNPDSTTFSYKPSYSKDEADEISAVNKEQLEWTGREITIKGEKYIYREIDKDIGTGELYDYDTYKDALKDPNIKPILVGTTEKNSEGKIIVKLNR